MTREIDAAIHPAFERAEYSARLAKVFDAMGRDGLDLLFVTDPSNMAWLTGYDGWSFYVHQGVLLQPGADPIWWGRNQDSAGARRTVWMGSEQVQGYVDTYVQATDRHPMQDLAEQFGRLGLSAARIGVEMDNYYFSAKAFAVLQESLQSAHWIDATGLVNWQRCIKSPAEIGFMRQAARISEKIMDGAVTRIAPGQPKNQVVAEIFRDAVGGVDGAWGDYPAIVPLMPSGADAAAPHLTWDGRPFEADASTTIEIAGCYRRYHVPFCRTVYLGKPPDQMRRAEAALIEGLEAGLQAARAGNRACDVARALAAPLERAGIDRGARCGYPIGLSYPPDWGERTISFRTEDDTMLLPGMTFHFMPGLWMDGWGMAITESILITEDGPAEAFCDRPRQLFVKP